MVHTVGIAGANGNVGAPTTKALVKAAEEGKIKLVIFHRDGSKPKDINSSANVDLRVLDFSDPEDKIEAAVKGVNVFISTVAVPAIPYEPRVVDVLARSPDMMVYIPSTLSTTWEEEDFKDPHRGPLMTFAHQGWDRAKEKGLSVTPIYTGAFDTFAFQAGVLLPPIKGNVVRANREQLKNRLPVTTMQHLSDVVARLAIADPETIKGREYSVVTFWPSGQEIVDLYTKINGQQAEIKDFTEADLDAMNNDAENYGPILAGYMNKWQNASFTYETGGKIIDNSYQGPSLEQVVRSFV